MSTAVRPNCCACGLPINDPSYVSWNGRDYHADHIPSKEPTPDLMDPVVVHVNMLRGSIAKPTFDQIKHLYAAEFAALAARKDGAWQDIETFPQDGEAYLATDNRVLGGFPQVVYWDDRRLHVPDAGISYMPSFFTHWRKLDEPPPT